ncbi:hypothetical protein [Aeromonas veronii]|uniref:hypothetical protein n=1 Tax=Aeromonas veronii TaxID=654 RepID=UPI000DCFA136|nr:hypothetical protein [Aeromonas veronii]
MKIRIPQSARGVLFRQLPLLCWRDNGFASLADAELFEEFSNFNLLNEAIELPYFAVNEQAKSWALDMERGRLSSSFVSATQMNLNGIQSPNTEQDLIGWLDSQLRQPNVFQRDMQAYLTQMLAYLTHTRKITLTALIRGKFQLADALQRDILARRKRAGEKGFQQELCNMEAAKVDDGMEFFFNFKPQYYAGRPPYYKGTYRFQKGNPPEKLGCL